MTNIAVRGTVLRSPADGSRVVTFRASTPRVDRHGTRILPMGITTESFSKNPVFLWGHDGYGGGMFGGVPSMDHVIGRVTSYSKTSEAFDIDVEFAPSEANPLAERAFQMVKRGFLNGVSVGFFPKKWHEEPGPEGKASVRVFDESELAEVSLCAIPSNADCIALARSYYGQRADNMTFDADELEAMETILRAGAVLNRANKAKLTQAADLVNQVLATAAKEEEMPEEDRGGPVIPPLIPAENPTKSQLPATSPNSSQEIATPADSRAVEDDNQDDDGVYIARKVKPEDAKKLAKWATDRGIKDVIDAEKMHVTVVYSRADFPADDLGDDDEEVSVKVKGIKRLKEAIVLTLDAPKIVARHKAARDKGASHDFKSYQPHISLSYAGPDSDLPDDFPSMSIKLGPEFRETIKDVEDRSAPPALNAADIGAATQVAIRAYLDRMAIQEGIKRALRAA